MSGEPLNQGSTPTCVGHAAVHFLRCGPVYNRVGHDPYILYAEAQVEDEWPGEDYEGTSVRAVAKVLKRRGLIAEYKWAFDVDTIMVHLLTRGPLMLGTNWYHAMFWPDDKGFIAPGTSQNAGGHAYLLIGGNQKLEKVQILNSWHPWGRKSRAFMRLTDLDRLIREDGEACVAFETRPTAV
jgi:hypothetical protein